MTSWEHVFNELSKLTKQFEHFLSYRVGTVDADVYKKQYDKLALQWKSTVENLTIKEKKHIFDDNIVVFHDIHKNLVGENIIYGHKKLVPLFRGAHDTIFGSLGIKRPSVKFKRIPTKAFTEYIKGITFFKTELVTENPVYHRSSSCGTGTLNIKQKFRHLKGYSLDSAQNNREHVAKCYIERLIYGEIYEMLLHSQDIAHKRELRIMERLYEDFYPGNNLRIHVKHYDGINPMLLIISNANYEETYEKNPSSNVVRCSKRYNGDNEKFFHKIQTFEKELPWIEGKLPKKTLMQELSYLRKPLSV